MAARLSIVPFVCVLAVVLALVVQPAAAQAQDAGDGTASTAPPGVASCPRDLADWRTSVLVESASAPAALGLGDLLRKVGGRTLCLGGCAAECGARAYPCLLRPTPGSIAACFAFRCGAKGAKCVRDCF